MPAARLLLPMLLSAAATALIGNSAPPQGRPGPERPVMVGGHNDLDACLTVAKVTGLKARGDNYLSLRSRPWAKARELMRLRPGQQVWACEETRDGWTGVLIGPADGSLDCGVGSPIAQRQPYGGQCQSGWVASRFLEVVAG